MFVLFWLINCVGRIEKAEEVTQLRARASIAEESPRFRGGPAAFGVMRADVYSAVEQVFAEP
jgi:hypothetical protein